MLIEVWFDLICPYSYIGRRNLAKALAGFAHRDEVEVLLRSFELDPDAPRENSQTLPESLIARSGESEADVLAMLARIEAKAARAGLQMNLSQARPVNTFDAHRLIYFAAQSGKQHQAADRLQQAYFTEAARLSKPETLVDLLSEIGLDREAATKAWLDDAFSHDVSADEFEARSMGVTGVPYVTIDGKLTLTGALEPEIYTEAIHRGWNARS